MTLKKYLDAADSKKKIKNVKHVSDIEKLIDSESDNIATEIDEIIGGATRYDGTEMVAFSNQYIVNHFDEAVNVLKSIYQRNGGCSR